MNWLKMKQKKQEIRRKKSYLKKNDKRKISASDEANDV